MQKQLSLIYKSVKDYSGTFANTSIALVTGAIQQLTTIAVYRCPCVDPSSLNPSCRNVSLYSFSCTYILNQGYGLAFILAPALALFIFSVSSSPRFWKAVTGRMHKLRAYKRGRRQTTLTVFKICSQSLIAPATWISIALVDGRYLACSITPLPYNVGGPSSTIPTCERLAALTNPRLSNAFYSARTFSQIIGAITLTVLLLLGFGYYCYERCSFPLTYYHAKYYNLYRQMEESEFDDEMRKKAQEDAQKNVRIFLEKKRRRALWDRISTVFQFSRGENNYALYTPLYELINCDDNLLEKSSSSENHGDPGAPHEIEMNPM